MLGKAALLLVLLQELSAVRLHLPARGDNTKQQGKQEKETPNYYTLSIEHPAESVWPQYWIESKDAIPLQPSNSASPIALPLPFSFPFYQTPNRLLFLYPGGLLSPSPTPALWSSCYIAPLSARLDPFHSPSSSLSWWTDKRNSSVTVEWREAVVSGIPHRAAFTLRVRLWHSGLIEFTYAKLGLPLLHLLPMDRDFVIGVSDSVSTGDGGQFRYHSMEVPKAKLSSHTVVRLTPASPAAPATPGPGPGNTLPPLEGRPPGAWLLPDRNIVSDRERQIQQQYKEGSEESKVSQESEESEESVESEESEEAEESGKSIKSNASEENDATKVYIGSGKVNSSHETKEYAESEPDFMDLDKPEVLKETHEKRMKINESLKFHDKLVKSVLTGKVNKKLSLPLDVNVEEELSLPVEMLAVLSVGGLVLVLTCGGLLLGARGLARPHRWSSLLPSSLPGVHLLLGSRGQGDSQVLWQELPRGQGDSQVLWEELPDQHQL